MEKEFDNTNKGSLHTNLKKAKEKDPDLTGSLNIDGKEYWLSGWKYISKAGSPYLSLSTRPKDELTRQTSQPTNKNPNRNKEWVEEYDRTPAKAKTNDPLDW